MRKQSFLSFTAIAVPPLFLACFSGLVSTSLLAAVLALLVMSTIFGVVIVKKKDRKKEAVEDETPASDQRGLLPEHVAETEVSQESEVEQKCEMLLSDFDLRGSSDCSLTDDEVDGLIEIAFQEGKPVIPVINEDKCGDSGDISKSPDVLSDDGLLADDDDEMGEEEEEDNLIELDISMGSIKLPKT